MLKQRREAADKVAADLFSAEAAVSNAVSSVAALVGTIQAARAGANLSVVVGNDAAFRAISCLRALGEANQELVQAHHDLSATKVQIGLGTTAGGVGGGDKPESLLPAPRADLRAVAA